MGAKERRQRQSKILRWVAESARLIPNAEFHATEQESDRYHIVNVIVNNHNQLFITHYWRGGVGPEGLKVHTPEDVRDYFRGADY